MLALGGTNTGIWKFFLVCHILVAIVGLGSVMLNGIYAAQAQKRPGPAGRGASEVNYFVSNIGEYFIYLIPVFGVLLVIFSNKGIKFSNTFVWMALALYFVAIAISHAVMFPGHKKINKLLLEMEQAPAPTGGVEAPPQVAEIQAIGKKMAPAGMALNLIVVVILFLMVWRPGLG
jgi:hypothetical protein